MTLQDEIQLRPQAALLQILHAAPPMTREKLLEMCVGLGLERSAAGKALDALIRMRFVREQDDGVMGVTDAVTFG